ncbi:uncharacterized protein CANTADRAFT_319500 [Suhomyces tanzawaensis NRRL Y-17324]|uniref:CHY-type domain-containing protein n=1 Tax=Suhomyces tanzawaensis NRRL Y-17324 TaxID=984487 RepID=A0A1E4SDR1_9ASCO|nr:uncharacterized protein CANTADRAFT_319500 [Suhomyces tanzawaensis NRRL Y-17324]ODV77654.1 hypothetical protein CANTADRAFT_319500 [Suhomyces tanzawaensis NRRL Y-17324]
MMNCFKLGSDNVPVCGSLVDRNTRCAHYHSVLDIVAIKFRCCGTYYPCYKCHHECTKDDHEPLRWSKKELKDFKVILCGNCYSELTFHQYSGGSATCILCRANFNPKCALDYDIYFEMSGAD